MLALLYGFLMALFMFGLYEAGNVIEVPFKARAAVVRPFHAASAPPSPARAGLCCQAVREMVPLDDLGHALSDDLTNLVDDPDNGVPVFLKKP